MTRLGVFAVLAVVLSAATVRSEPIGALGVAGTLGLAGDDPRHRVSGDAIVYVAQRYGVYAALARATTDPWLDAGQATIGVAMRAAAARPLLDIVLHGDAGVAWPMAPVIGGGVTAYLWPMKSVPVALTSGMSAYLLIEDVRATQFAIGLSLGLAIAR